MRNGAYDIAFSDDLTRPAEMWDPRPYESVLIHGGNGQSNAVFLEMKVRFADDYGEVVYHRAAGR
jgi:hypothetical protein